MCGGCCCLQLAKQSPTYSKYYTYLTYVWCRHVLFIALDSKIIGENGSRFLLFLFDEFIVLFVFFSFPNFTYKHCRTMKHEQNGELLFEHVCKIKAPTKCDARGELDLRNKSKTAFTVMTIALNWGQHIVVSTDENKHSNHGGREGKGSWSNLIAFCFKSKWHFLWFMSSNHFTCDHTWNSSVRQHSCDGKLSSKLN